MSNIAFVESVALSAERQKLLLTLLGCSRQRKYVRNELLIRRCKSSV